MTNNTNYPITVVFNEPNIEPFYLKSGESLPWLWEEAYTVKSCHKSA